MANLDKEIQTAIESQTDIFSSDINALNGQIEDSLMYISEENNVQEIDEYRKNIDNYITKKAKITGELSPTGSFIKSLIEQKYQLEKKLLEGSKVITATTSGIVSYRIDNLEEELSTTNFKNITKDLLEEKEIKTGRIITTSNDKAKIVNNFKCYIVISSSTDEAKKAEVGDKITLRLSTGEEIKAKIEHINEEVDSKILIFRITEMVEKLIDYRKISLDVIWWQAEGLKVSNEAIIYQNGLSYVLKRDNNKDRMVLVKVIKESDEYAIVSSYKTEELIELGFKEEEINKMEKINLYDEIALKPKL